MENNTTSKRKAKPSEVDKVSTRNFWGLSGKK